LTDGPVALRERPPPEAEDGSRSELRLLEHVARQACRSHHADGAAVTMLEAGQPGALMVVAAQGDAGALKGRVFAGDLGLTGQACARGEPVVATSSEYRGLPPAERPSGLRAVAAAPIRVDGRVWGAVTMLAGAPVCEQRDEVIRDVEDLAALASAAVQNAADAEARKEALRAEVAALGTLLDLRDGYTSEHTEAVVEVCCAIGRHMHLAPDDLDVLRSAARLHDLGKIGVPDHVLHKPGPLTGDEWEVMRRHPAWGAAALQRIPGFAPVAEAVRAHHERWDGEGYPDGLAAEHIPLVSRIITVSDAYQAMTSNRPYRRALGPEDAMRRMRGGAGSQFDPGVVEAFAGLRADELRVLRDRRGSDAAPSASGDRARDRGRFARPGQPRRGGKALAEALARATRLPALTESRDRVLRLLDDVAPDPQDLIAVIESDIALTVTVLRAAGRLEAPSEVTGVADAVRHLDGVALRTAVGGMPTIDFFQRLPGITAPAEHVRLHALAAKRAAERLVRTLERDDADQILAIALLHDVGKLVLEQAYDAYPQDVLAGAHTPDERVVAERRQLGMDHALLGGVLLRRWEISEQLISAVERHHDPDATGPAAVVRLADMLAHYTHARPVAPRAMLSAGRHLGLTPTQLRALMFDLSQAAIAGPRATRPNPLTPQEHAVLRQLATGKVYKEIGTELGIAASTVRSHCNSMYRKLDVIDRANAVLTAAENGWI
jgi:putative nucleotidyltransferase with HDIG domain